MPRFAFRRFLSDQFRSPAALQALIAAYGFDTPKLSTVQKWWSRASVPAHVFPVLLMIAELERGTRVELMTYVSGGRTK